MAYTQTDLANVKSAIIALATGERVVKVTIDGKTIEYSDAKINQLRMLREEIINELRSSSSRRRYVLTQTNKGL